MRAGSRSMRLMRSSTMRLSMKSVLSLIICLVKVSLRRSPDRPPRRRSASSGLM